MAHDERITFDDPPIIEVVLGRTFLPRPDFLVPYYGAFWERVKGRFPVAQHAAPILDAQSGASGDPFFLPRVWLQSEDSTTLIQLQNNRFHFNWRQTEQRETYIRFPAIRSECLRVWSEFEKFVLEVTGQPLQPHTAELSYVNVITLADARDPIAIFEAAIRDYKWDRKGRFLPPPRGVNFQQTFPAPSGKGVLNVTAAAARKKGADEPAVKLELTINGPCAADESFEEWSQSAHDFLVEAFKDLTTPAMHKQWKLKGTKR